MIIDYAMPPDLNLIDVTEKMKNVTQQMKSGNKCNNNKDNTKKDKITWGSVAGNSMTAGGECKMKYTCVTII